jgi:uncharacterized membrane protein YtjA (UPF0391 family)
MLGWAVLFFIVAFIFGIFDFFGIASASTGIANVLLVILIGLFMIFLYKERRTRV